MISTNFYEFGTHWNLTRSLSMKCFPHIFRNVPRCLSHVHSWIFIRLVLVRTLASHAFWQCCFGFVQIKHFTGSSPMTRFRPVEVSSKYCKHFHEIFGAFFRHVHEEPHVQDVHVGHVCPRLALVVRNLKTLFWNFWVSTVYFYGFLRWTYFRDACSPVTFIASWCKVFIFETAWRAYLLWCRLFVFFWNWLEFKECCDSGHYAKTLKNRSWCRWGLYGDDTISYKDE